MQIVKGTLLFGTSAEQFRFMQPSYVLVENVFVVRETGQGTMYRVVQTEEFLRVLIKSFMWSLSSFF